MKVLRAGRTWLLGSGLLALLVAGLAFRLAYTNYNRLVATRLIVVAAEEIPPYTIVTPSHLTTKAMPRALERENIYLSPNEVVGKITTSYVPAGAPIYRSQAVPPERFRYVQDPTLEIVSIPVDPARAVGGQLRIGQVVNVYRVARGRGAPEETTPAALLEARGAEVELLAVAPVVDVRSGRGEPVVVGAPAPSRMEREARPRGNERPLQIVTLAVRPDVAEDLIRLAVEQEGQNYELWLSLAPLPPTEPTMAGRPPTVLPPFRGAGGDSPAAPPPTDGPGKEVP